MFNCNFFWRNDDHSASFSLLSDGVVGPCEARYIALTESDFHLAGSTQLLVPFMITTVVVNTSFTKRTFLFARHLKSLSSFFSIRLVAHFHEVSFLHHCKEYLSSMTREFSASHELTPFTIDAQIFPADSIMRCSAYIAIFAIKTRLNCHCTSQCRTRLTFSSTF